MFATFINLLTLVVSAPLKYVSQVRQASQKPSHTWIVFCQWYFPRLSVKDHFALVHLSVRYALPQLLKQLMLFGPVYRIVLPNNVIDNLKKAHQFVSITEFVDMIEVLVMYESEMGENVFEDGSCLVQILKDMISLLISDTKNVIMDIDININDLLECIENDEDDENDFISSRIGFLISVKKSKKEKKIKKVEFGKGVLNLIRERKILTSEEKKMQRVLSLLIHEKGREFGDCFHAFILPKLKEQEN